MRNYVCYLLWLALLLPAMTALADDKPTQVLPTTDIQPYNTKSFFEGFVKCAEPPKRGDFETDADYKKRLPKTIDPDHVCYFAVDPSLNLKDYIHHYSTTFDPNYQEDGKPYSYDMNNAILHLCVGIYDRCFALDTKMKSFYDHGLPVIIADQLFDHSRFEGMNSYGATFPVTRYYHNKYILNIINMDKCLRDIYNPTDTIKSEMDDIHIDIQHQSVEYLSKRPIFRISIKLPPDQAKLIVNNNEWQVLLGVKMRNYNESFHGNTGASLGTLTNPVEEMTYSWVINANLVKVVVINTTTKAILTQYDIPEGTWPDFNATVADPYLNPKQPWDD